MVKRACNYCGTRVLMTINKALAGSRQDIQQTCSRFQDMILNCPYQPTVNERLFCPHLHGGYTVTFIRVNCVKDWGQKERRGALSAPGEAFHQQKQGPQ